MMRFDPYFAKLGLTKSGDNSEWLALTQPTVRGYELELHIGVVRIMASPWGLQRLI
jgi:hypothetical protein